MKLQTLPTGLLHVNRAFPSSNHSTESSALAFKMTWNRNFSVYSQEKSFQTFVYEASDTANWPLHVNRAFPSSNHSTESSALAFKIMWNRNFSVYSQEKSCLTFVYEASDTANLPLHENRAFPSSNHSTESSALPFKMMWNRNFSVYSQEKSFQTFVYEASDTANWPLHVNRAFPSLNHSTESSALASKMMWNRNFSVYFQEKSFETFVYEASDTSHWPLHVNRAFPSSNYSTERCALAFEILWNRNFSVYCQGKSCLTFVYEASDTANWRFHVNRAFPSSNHSTESSALAFKMMWNRNFSVYSQEKSFETFVYEASDSANWRLHVNRAFPSSNHSTESSALASKMMWNRNFRVYSQEKSFETFVYEASDTSHWPLHVNRAFPSSNYSTESCALAFKIMWNRNFSVYCQEKSCLTFVYEASDTANWRLHVNRAFPSSNHSTESSALAFKMMWNRNLSVYSQEKSFQTFVYEASDTANWHLHVNRAFPRSNHSTESSALGFKMMWNRNFSVYSQEKSFQTFVYGASDTANWPLHVNRAFPSSNHSTESSALASKMMWNRNFRVYSQEKSCLTFVYEASDTANWRLHVNSAFPSSNHSTESSALAFKMMWNQNVSVYSQEKSCLPLSMKLQTLPIGLCMWTELFLAQIIQQKAVG